LIEEVGSFGVLRDGVSDTGAAITTRGNIDITGNVSVINRYTSATIKAGGSVNIGDSGTYVRDLNYETSEVTYANLVSSDDGVYTTASSSINLGKGVDVLENDPNLRGISGEVFFENFFSKSKAEMKALASGSGTEVTGDNCHNSNDSNSPGIVNSNSITTSGIYWVEGNCSITNSDVGSVDSPAIVIVNGDLTFKGDFYGLLYIVGDYSISGGGNIQGAVMIEGAASSGVGDNTRIVYDREVLGNAGGNQGNGGAVAGTWKDF